MLLYLTCDIADQFSAKAYHADPHTRYGVVVINVEPRLANRSERTIAFGSLEDRTAYLSEQETQWTLKGFVVQRKSH